LLLPLPLPLRLQALRLQALRLQALRLQALRPQALRPQALRLQALKLQALKLQALRQPSNTVYNTTGENVTELYLYVAGSEDKGENLAADGLADGDSVVLTLPEDADKSAEYVLEFTTEGGDTQSFDTLSYEVAPISLLSVDAAAGATPISFTAPEQ
jgi:hypothetical protein